MSGTYEDGFGQLKGGRGRSGNGRGRSRARHVAHVGPPDGEEYLQERRHDRPHAPRPLRDRAASPPRPRATTNGKSTSSSSLSRSRCGLVDRACAIIGIRGEIRARAGCGPAGPCSVACRVLGARAASHRLAARRRSAGARGRGLRAPIACYGRGTRSARVPCGSGRVGQRRRLHMSSSRIVGASREGLDGRPPP
jgi:hypothetical protein